MTILLLSVTTIAGICSFDASRSYEFVNQYGDTVKMWGSGIYARDSYFKAPIFIGSDVTILLFVVPLSIVSFLKTLKKKRRKLYLQFRTSFYAALLFCKSGVRRHL